MKFKRFALIGATAAMLVTAFAVSPASAYLYPYRWISYSSPTRYVSYTVPKVQQTNAGTSTTKTQPKTTTAATPTAAKTATPASTPTQTSTAAGLAQAEQQMLNLVNQERAKYGLKPLQADLQLTQIARLKSQDMINKGYFGHQSPTYGSPFDMMARYGVTYRTAGENLAGNSSVAAAHTALMNSPGHRANILKADYTHIGIGIVNGGSYGMMFTQMFVGR